MDVAQHWRAYLFVGVLNSSLPFCCSPSPRSTLPASYLVILNTALPLLCASHRRYGWRARSTRARSRDLRPVPRRRAGRAALDLVPDESFALGLPRASAPSRATRSPAYG